MNKVVAVLIALLFATPSHAAIDMSTVGYVDVANESNFDFDSTNSFSISGWYYITSFTNYNMLVTKITDSAPYTGWDLITDITTGAVDVQIISTITTDWLSVATTAAFPLNRWTHLIFTYDGSKTPGGCKFYFDGNLQATSTTANLLSGSILNNFNLRLGSRNGVTTFFYPGMMDDVRIYNRVLSQSETKTLALSRNRKIITDGLVGWWKMDDGVNGQVNGTARDFSGRGNTGTLTSGPIWKGSPWLNYP